MRSRKIELCNPRKEGEHNARRTFTHGQILRVVDEVA
jgi:hypothetical protein